jgi:hypothetical protein
MIMQARHMHAATLLIGTVLMAMPHTGWGQASPAPAGTAAAPIPRPDELEPGVDTSKSVPAATTATAAPSAPPVPAPAPKAATGASSASGGSSASKSAAGAKPAAKKGADRLELEATDVTGNSELPKVLYIVPWKRSDLGDMVGRPVNSLLDEVLQPVDRDVFKRENRYYDAVKSQPGGAKSDAAQDSVAKP